MVADCARLAMTACHRMHKMLQPHARLELQQTSVQRKTAMQSQAAGLISNQRLRTLSAAFSFYRNAD